MGIGTLLCSLESKYHGSSRINNKRVSPTLIIAALEVMLYKELKSQFHW